VEEQGCDEEEYFLCARSMGGGVDFLACMDGSKDGSPEDKAKTCASSTSLPWESISSCFSGSQGKELLTEAAKDIKQRFPSGLGVPHVSVNGKQVSGLSYDGLLQDLCDTGITAGACSHLLVV